MLRDRLLEDKYYFAMVGDQEGNSSAMRPLHELQSTPSAMLSRHSEKRHGQPVPHQFKVILPCPSSERGLGCKPFNKCGSFAASCQAALPQPFAASASPAMATTSAGCPHRNFHPAAESAHCYGVHVRYESNCSVSPSIAFTRPMMP